MKATVESRYLHSHIIDSLSDGALSHTLFIALYSMRPCGVSIWPWMRKRIFRLRNEYLDVNGNGLRTRASSM